MLILCLILLSLTAHAFGRNADRRGNTEGRGTEEELHWRSVVAGGKKKPTEKTPTTSYLVFPSGYVSKNVLVGKQDSQSLHSRLYFLLSSAALL